MHVCDFIVFYFFGFMMVFSCVIVAFNCNNQQTDCNEFQLPAYTVNHYRQADYVGFPTRHNHLIFEFDLCVII